MHDYHAHSSFSGDCSFSMEEMVIGAIEKGCESIAFTDHIDFDYGDYNYQDLFIFKPESYISEFEKLKKKYERKIRMLSGVEMGMQPHLVEKIEEMFPFSNFDFTIMSIHTADRKDLHEGIFFEDKSSLEAYKKYYEELLYCVENFKNYQIIGHINLIDRYKKFVKEDVPFSSYSYIVEEILKSVIKDGKGLEVNTSGFRYGMNSFLPDDKILSLYKKLGGKIITFGSDTHCPDDVLKYYGQTLKTLSDMNFKEISILNGSGNFEQLNISEQIKKTL